MKNRGLVLKIKIMDQDYKKYTIFNVVYFFYK